MNADTASCTVRRRLTCCYGPEVTRIHVGEGGLHVSPRGAKVVDQHDQQDPARLPRRAPRTLKPNWPPRRAASDRIGFLRTLTGCYLVSVP